jgi:glutathione synthase/RimK-type ligase-like ATP-grasp enzyme
LHILIVTVKGDPHARAVAWGLRRLGHTPTLWYWSDFPKHDLGTLRIGPGAAPAVALTLGGTVHASPFDVIWKRRLGAPEAMQPCHPDDADVIVAESQRYLDNLLPFMGHAGTRWINHPEGDFRARSKVRQLAVAGAAGLAIPDTLIGNDIAEVRRFFDRHGGRVVNKAFAPARWDNADGSRTTARTSAITRAHLQHDYAVRASPGIYQQMIDKQYELRVTVMGERAVAAAIDSQQDGPTVDWRYEGGRGNTNLRHIALDPALQAQCVAVCKALGIAFGCIDLIVKPGGEVVFLEVNEGGQFLFNELADPRIPMLDAFCRFLLGDAADAGAPRVALADYHATDEYRAAVLAERTAARQAA